MTTMEYEPEPLKDLQALKGISPRNAEYENKTWRDGNGHSHAGHPYLGRASLSP
ncbi:MAG: hypothetical protein ACUVQ0_01405 [Thermoproteota archaeon]